MGYEDRLSLSYRFIFHTYTFPDLGRAKESYGVVRLLFLSVEFFPKSERGIESLRASSFDSR